MKMKLFHLLLCVIFLIPNGECAPESLGAADDTPLRPFGNGFYNVRVPFLIKLLGREAVDIGTHMSLIQLKTGNFLVIDTVEINDQLKRQLDELTNNGTKIEAVLAVHPFHTLFFPAFYKMYPNAKYYGTPRHLRKLKEINWTGQLDNAENIALLSKWAQDVELRIPDGAEFFDPQPESSNHFVSIFVYHRGSKTVHVYDTLIYADNPNWIIRIILGAKDGAVVFHPAIRGSGLYHTAAAPLQFRDWMKKMLTDWDFDNLCTAHVGAKIGGAHTLVEKLVKESEELFEELSERNKK